MKHILLFVFTGLVASGVFAQTCTPDGNYAGSAPGLYPAGPLGPTCELIAPKTIVSLTDTNVTSPIAATLYITRMRINSVTGLPTGLLLSTDVIGTADQDGPWGYWDNTGSVPNQTSALGCAYVYGSGGDWDAAVGGGPNNDGVYPLVFEVDAYIPSADPAIVGTFVGLPRWVSQIDPGSGGGSFYILDTLVVPSDYADISTSISGDQNVTPSVQYTYSVPAAAGVTYNWTVNNGTIISGQGTNEVVVEWNGSGSIEVDLTDGGCSGNDTRSVTATPTALDEVAGINASVYPNPSNGLYTLRLDDGEAVNIRIMNISGKVILNQRLGGSSRYSIDLENSPVGVYIMEIETAEGRTFKRLIKN